MPSGGSASALPSTTPLTIASGGTLDLGGDNQQVASLSDSTTGSGGSIINSSTAASLLTVSPSGGTTTFSGTIGGTQGAISLVMSGSGTQVQAGSLLGSGNLTINAGALILGGANPLAGVTTLSGGTLGVNNPLALEGQTLDINLSAVSTLNLSPSLSSLTLGGLMGSRNLVAPAGPLTIGGNGASTTYSGNVSGAASLTKTGSGTLYLSGSNSFGNAPVVAGGVLDAATTASLTTGSFASLAVSVSGGAGITVQTGNGAATGWTSSQISTLLTNGNWASGAILGIDTSNLSLTYSGNITTGLTKLGANPLTLTGAVSASGPLTVGTGAVNIYAASPSVGGLAGAGNLVLANTTATTTLTVASNANSTFSGVISSPSTVANLVKTGPNMLTLTASNGYSGGTTVSQGVLVSATTSSIGTGPLNLAGGTFQPTVALSSGLSASYYGPNTGLGYFTAAQNSLSNFNTVYLLPAGPPTSTNNITANVVNGAKGNFDFDTTGEGSLFPGQFAYGAPLNAGGTVPGTQVNNWASSYTGYFYAATTGTYTFGLNSDDNSRLWINAGQANPDTAVVINGVNGQGWAGYGVIQASGTVNLTGGQYYPITIGYEEGGGGFGLEAFVAPPGVTLANNEFLPVSLLYAGNPLVSYANALTVTKNSTINLPTSSFIALQFPSLSISAGTLNTTGGVTGSSVTITGPTTLTGSATFNVGSNAPLTLAGVVSGGGLVETGSGALILQSANTYTGPTVLNAGTLVAANGSNGSATGNGQVTLNGGVLASDPNLFGTIGGNVLAGSGANTIAPGGIGSIGTLDIGGNLTLNSRSTLDFDLSLTAAGDLLNIGGFLSVTGTANVAFSGLAAPNTTYTLATFNAASPVSLSNFNVPAGYVLQISSGELELISAPIPVPTWSALSGSWTNAANWNTGTVPNAQAAQAVVGAGTTTPVTITLDGQQTLGTLTFANPLSLSATTNCYTLAPGNSGSLVMDNTGGTAATAQIFVTGSGSYAISAPLILAGSLSVVPSAGTTLAISGNISEEYVGSGALLLDGPGTLVLSGTNSYSAGTTVTAGTLIVQSPSALLDGSNLTVGNDTSIFAVSKAAAPIAASGDVAAVPEPGTLVLLGAAGIVAAAATRRRRKVEP